MRGAWRWAKRCVLQVLGGIARVHRNPARIGQRVARGGYGRRTFKRARGAEGAQGGEGAEGGQGTKGGKGGEEGRGWQRGKPSAGVRDA